MISPKQPRWYVDSSHVVDVDTDVRVVVFSPAESSSAGVAARLGALLNDDERARRLLPKARAVFDWAAAPLALVALVVDPHRPNIAAALAGAVVGISIGAGVAWRMVDGRAFANEKRDERVALAVDKAMEMAHGAQRIDEENAVWRALNSDETAVVKLCHWCPMRADAEIEVGPDRRAVPACDDHLALARLGEVRPRTNGDTPRVDLYDFEDEDVCDHRGEL